MEHTSQKKGGSVTMKVASQLSLLFPVLVEALGLQLLPLQLILLLDLQVAVQLRLTDR